jgi:Beta-propeller repeat
MFERIARRVSICVCLSVCASLLVVCGMASAQEGSSAKVKLLASQPIGFEPNRGQAEAAAKFVGRTPNMTLSFFETGVEIRGGQGKLILRFVGGNEDPEVNATDPQAAYSNYILGNDASRWIGHVPQFGRVKYIGLYPGVDAVFYGNSERLEHDFRISPGADYHAIRIRVEGAQALSLQSDGSLKAVFDEGDFVFAKPEIYQLLGGEKKWVTGHYLIMGGSEFGFAVGKYDRSKPLIIDPTLTFATYLANLQVLVGGVATDAQGNTYIAGMAASSSYPTTPGAFQTTCDACGPSSNFDVFVTKMNAEGTGLVYSTFIGGSNYDQPFGIAVDKNGNGVVAGISDSPDFPVKNPVMTVTSGNGAQYAFISSLSTDGSKLNYSSLLGDGSTMTSLGAVAVDSNGNAYIAGATDSLAFPGKAIIGPAPTGYPNDALYVSKFLTTGALGYSSFVGVVTPQNGGGGLIGAEGIAVDGQGSAYVAGSGGDLYPTTSGAYQTTIPGATPYDAVFVTKLSPDGSALVYSTFLGEGGQASGIVLDGNGDAFVTGFGVDSNFPTTANAYQKTLAAGACCVSFLSELNPSGSQLLYSTFFGGNLTQHLGNTYASVSLWTEAGTCGFRETAAIPRYL